MEATGDQMVRTRPGGGVVAAALPHMGGDIAAHVLVDARARVIERLFQIDNRGQYIELDTDVGKRILRDITTVRQDDGQRLADVAHLVLGQRYLRALIERDAGDRRGGAPGAAPRPGTR